MTWKPKFGYVLPEKRTYGAEREHSRILQDTPLLSAAGTSIRGTGAGKVALPFKMLKQVAGFYPMTRQTIGDCVSHGFAKCAMVVYAVDILERRENEEWRAEIASEWIYGASRVLAGKGRLGNSDGSIGSWAAKAVSDHGLLWRLQYRGHDLRKYSGRRAKSWGYRDLPYELEETADETPVSMKPALVNSYEDARDAIANGYCVPVCSGQGFTSKRDRQGFCRASGRWAHCMAFVGSDDTSRPGLLCDNSWGANYHTGPRRHDQPESSFWVDAKTADSMLRQNDSFAIPGVDGFKRTAIDWSPW